MIHAHSIYMPQSVPLIAECIANLKLKTKTQEQDFSLSDDVEEVPNINSLFPYSFQQTEMQSHKKWFLLRVKSMTFQ